MEFWMFLAAGSALGWAFVVLLDKFVIDSEIDNAMGTGGIHALFNCLAVAAVSLLVGGISFSLPVLGAGLVLGVLYVLANYFWFSGVGDEEVSRFAPVLSFDVAFIAVLSFIFLQQSFTLPVYAGMALTVLGCVLISLEDPMESFSRMKSKWALMAALASAFTYSVREVFFQHVSAGFDIWTLLFFYGATGSLFSLVLVYRAREDLTGRIEGLEHMILSGLISGGSQSAFFLAVSLGSASLVSTITKTRFLVIFFAATAISRLHPEIIHEPLERRVLVQKLVATVMIITGVLAATLL
ncbi:MAG: EamA family transporter [Candidatus Nanosalina sp.]